MPPDGSRAEARFPDHAGKFSQEACGTQPVLVRWQRGLHRADSLVGPDFMP